MLIDDDNNDANRLLPLPEGSRWLVCWPEPFPQAELLSWTMQVRVIGIRDSNVCWILLSPSEARQLRGRFSELRGAITRDGCVWVPLDGDDEKDDNASA